MGARSFWPILLLLPIVGGCNSTKQANSNSGPGAPADSTTSTGPSPTYCRDVAPILYARCAKCHRRGEVAPFSLLTFADAHAHARQIREVTEGRFMPPWLAEPGHVPFQDERRLTLAEINTLAKWVDAGAVEGDPHDLSPQPQFTPGWQLGKPDVVLESPPFQLPPDGPDRFRNFVLTVPLDRPRWIRAVELRPENLPVTHHARLGLDMDRESERRDAADPQPGYEGMAWGQDPKGQLITWTPGMTPDAGAAGAAWKLAPDTKLVLHTHLQPSGKTEAVRFRVGLYFADGPPTIQPMILRIGSRNVDIPPGDARHVIEDNYTLPIDVDLESIFPHAHKLCQEIVVDAILPDGTTQTLIAIRHFDENWHDKYRLASSLRLPQGTRLRTRSTYDNTAANVRNPNHPPQRVVYGSNADDEMSDVFLQVTPADPLQHAVLEEHQSQAELHSKIVGYQKTLQLHPGDRWSIEGLASCYLANHQPQLAITLLTARPQSLAESPQAQVVAGMAQVAAGDGAAAEAMFRQALATDDQLALAWLGLAQSQVAQQNDRQAEPSLRRAIDLAPHLTVARLDLIDLFVRHDRLDDALAAARAAVDAAPDEHLPLLKLADVFARRRNYAASLTTFAAARQLAPFVYSPPCSLAIVCYQLGDEKSAARFLTESITLDTADPAPYCFLGQIARRDANLPAARRHLQQALDLPLPRTWPASHVRQFLKLVYTEQLQLAQQLQDKPLALGALRAWVKLEPDNAAVAKLLGDIEGAEAPTKINGPQ